MRRGVLRLCWVLVAAVVLPLGVPLPVSAASSVVVDLGTSPTYGLVVDNTRGHVFVSLPQLNRVRVYSYSGRLLATLAMSVPADMIMSPSGGAVYVRTGVGDGYTPSAIVAISTSTLKVAWRMAAGSRCLSGLASVAGRLWSTTGCGGVNTLISFSPAARGSGWRSTRYNRLNGPLSLTSGDYNTGLLTGYQPDASGGELYTWHISGATATKVSEATMKDTEDAAQYTERGTRLMIADSNRSYGYGTDIVDPRHLSTLYSTYTADSYPTAAAISPSGRHLVIGAQPGLRLYNSSTPSRPAASWNIGFIHYNNLVVPPDARHLICVVWTINNYDGHTPPRFKLEIRSLSVANW